MTDAHKKLALQVRVKVEEKRGFFAAARLAGLSLSAWIRTRLRAAAKSELAEHGKKDPFEREDE